MLKKIYKKLPTQVNLTVQRLALLSLISQITIVITGGAVRLTSSGLGCPEWPKCTTESLITTREMGAHGIIEFGNRAITFILVFISVAMILSILRFRKERKDIFILSLIIMLGIPAQAIIGGITVLMHLNPWIVGLHFLLSSFMIALATLLFQRTRDTGKKSKILVPINIKNIAKTIVVLIFVTIILGIIVTGSGPHSGDSLASRNGLDSYILTRMHVIPVYIIVVLTIYLLQIAYRRRYAYEIKKNLLILFCCQLAQGIIGYTQYFLGLPEILVALHMLGSCLLIVAGMITLDTMYERKKIYFK